MGGRLCQLRRNVVSEGRGQRFVPECLRNLERCRGGNQGKIAMRAPEPVRDDSETPANLQMVTTCLCSQVFSLGKILSSGLRPLARSSR
jgi:hypothetical protein